MADRLISADKLKKEIVDWKVKTRSQNQDYNTGYFSALSAVEGILAYAYTVDAVEVVRCKDCKWYRIATIDYVPYCCHESGYCGEHMGGMFFCACGERKDNAE